MNVTAAQFFTNAVNTTTIGLDVVLNYSLTLGNNDRLGFSFVSNINSMQVDEVNTTGLLEGKEDSYFGQETVPSWSTQRLVQSSIWESPIAIKISAPTCISMNGPR